MEAKQVKELMEVYASVYTQSQEVISEAECEEEESDEKDTPEMNGKKKGKKGKQEKKEMDEKDEEMKEEVNLFDVILEHLVAEGYADTNKAALAIMANMSEEWKQSIVEQSNTLITPEQRRADELKYGMKRTTPIPPARPTGAKVKSGSRMPL
jgi:hypothetical protein